MGDARQQVVGADGARIAVTLRGSGPLVALIPSLGRGAADFDDLSRRLAEAGYTAAAIDPRGAGESCGAAYGLTLHDYAADVAAVIEACGDGPAHVTGHAFGNRVARCLAADRPDLVETVTLLAAGGMVPPEPERRAALNRCFRLDLPEDQHLATIAQALFAPGNDPSPWRGGWWPCVAAAEMQAGRRTPRDDWWTAGVAPLHVIQGLDDAIAPPANGYRLRDELPGRVQLVDLPAAGHALLPEQPEVIAEHMIGYFAEHGSTAAE